MASNVVNNGHNSISVFGSDGSVTLRGRAALNGYKFMVNYFKAHQSDTSVPVPGLENYRIAHAMVSAASHYNQPNNQPYSNGYVPGHSKSFRDFLRLTAEQLYTRKNSNGKSNPNYNYGNHLVGYINHNYNNIVQENSTTTPNTSNSQNPQPTGYGESNQPDNGNNNSNNVPFSVSPIKGTNDSISLKINQPSLYSPTTDFIASMPGYFDVPYLSNHSSARTKTGISFYNGLEHLSHSNNPVNSFLYDRYARNLLGHYMMSKNSYKLRIRDKYGNPKLVPQTKGFLDILDPYISNADARVLSDNLSSKEVFSRRSVRAMLHLVKHLYNDGLEFNVEDSNGSYIDAKLSNGYNIELINPIHRTRKGGYTDDINYIGRVYIGHGNYIAPSTGFGNNHVLSDKARFGAIDFLTNNDKSTYSNVSINAPGSLNPRNRSIHFTANGTNFIMKHSISKNSSYNFLQKSIQKKYENGNPDATLSRLVRSAAYEYMIMLLGARANSNTDPALARHQNELDRWIKQNHISTDNTHKITKAVSDSLNNKKSIPSTLFSDPLFVHLIRSTFGQQSSSGSKHGIIGTVEYGFDPSEVTHVLNRMHPNDMSNIMFTLLRDYNHGKGYPVDKINRFTDSMKRNATFEDNMISPDQNSMMNSSDLKSRYNTENPNSDQYHHDKFMVRMLSTVHNQLTKLGINDPNVEVDKNGIVQWNGSRNISVNKSKSLYKRFIADSIVNHNNGFDLDRLGGLGIHTIDNKPLSTLLNSKASFDDIYSKIDIPTRANLIPKHSYVSTNARILDNLVSNYAKNYKHVNLTTDPNNPCAYNHTERIGGHIGQIFAPDAHGIIKTNFKSSDNFDVVPGIVGYYKFGKGDRRARMFGRDYEYMVKKSLDRMVTSQVFRTRPSEYLVNNFDTTSARDCNIMNSLYRKDLYGKRIEHNWYENSPLPDSYKDARLATLRGRVRFPNKLIDINNSLADYSFGASKRNQAALRKLVDNHDMRILDNSSEKYTFDPVMSGQGPAQGKVRFLSQGAKLLTSRKYGKYVGQFVPSGCEFETVNENGNSYRLPVKDKNGMFKIDPKKAHVDAPIRGIRHNLDHDPSDRNMMGAHQNMTSLNYTHNANVMLAPVGGHGYDDGANVSKHFADHNPIPDGEATDAVDNFRQKINATFGTNLDKNSQKDNKIMADLLNRNSLYANGHININNYISHINSLLGVKIIKGYNSKKLNVLMHGLKTNNDFHVGAFDPNSKEIKGHDYPSFISHDKSRGLKFDYKNGKVYRPLMIGDKISENHGNKATISEVVNPDAKHPENPELTNIFHNNKDLDVIMSSYSIASRSNTGIVHDMQDNNKHAKEAHDDSLAIKPVKDRQGHLIGYKGNEDILVTDQTADKKTNAYTPHDIELGKGRKLSVQLGWALIQNHAYGVLRSAFKDNNKSLKALNQYMHVVGFDIDKKGHMTYAYDNTGNMSSKLKADHNLGKHAINHFNIGQFKAYDPKNDPACKYAHDKNGNRIITKDKNGKSIYKPSKKYEMYGETPKTPGQQFISAISTKGGILDLSDSNGNSPLKFNTLAKQNIKRPKKIHGVAQYTKPDKVTGLRKPKMHSVSRPFKTNQLFILDPDLRRSTEMQNGADDAVVNDFTQDYSRIFTAAYNFYDNLHKLSNLSNKFAYDMQNSKTNVKSSLISAISNNKYSNNYRIRRSQSIRDVKNAFIKNNDTDSLDALKDYFIHQDRYQKNARIYHNNIGKYTTQLQNKIATKQLGGLSGATDKHNYVRKHVLSHRMPHSATSIVTSNPKENFDTVEVSPQVAKSLFGKNYKASEFEKIDPKTGKTLLTPSKDKNGKAITKNGKAVYSPEHTSLSRDRILMFRDPCLHAGSVRSFHVKVNPNLIGVRFNGAEDKSFDGDFDGDTYGLINPNPTIKYNDVQLKNIAKDTNKPSAQRVKASRDYKLYRDCQKGLDKISEAHNIMAPNLDHTSPGVNFNTTLDVSSGAAHAADINAKNKFTGIGNHISGIPVKSIIDPVTEKPFKLQMKPATPVTKELKGKNGKPKIVQQTHVFNGKRIPDMKANCVTSGQQVMQRLHEFHENNDAPHYKQLALQVNDLVKSGAASYVKNPSKDPSTSTGGLPNNTKSNYTLHIKSASDQLQSNFVDFYMKSHGIDTDKFENDEQYADKIMDHHYHNPDLSNKDNDSADKKSLKHIQNVINKSALCSYASDPIDPRPDDAKKNEYPGEHLVNSLSRMAEHGSKGNPKKIANAASFYGAHKGKTIVYHHHTYKVGHDTKSVDMPKVVSGMIMPKKGVGALHNGETLRDEFQGTQYAMGVKADDTAIAGSYSQKAVMLTRRCAIDAIEATYPATQGTLQSKHNPVQSTAINNTLNKNLKYLLAGGGHKLNEYKWVHHYCSLYTNKYDDPDNPGMGVPINRYHVKRLANTIMTGNPMDNSCLNPNSQAIMPSVNDAIDRNKPAVLDQLGYGNGVKGLNRLAKHNTPISTKDNSSTNVYTPQISDDKDHIVDYNDVSNRNDNLKYALGNYRRDPVAVRAHQVAQNAKNYIDRHGQSTTPNTPDKGDSNSESVPNSNISSQNLSNKAKARENAKKRDEAIREALERSKAGNQANNNNDTHPHHGGPDLSA